MEVGTSANEENESNDGSEITPLWADLTCVSYAKEEWRVSDPEKEVIKVTC